MIEKMPIALVDMDGTVADYNGAMSRALAQLASPGEPDPDSFANTENPAWLEARRQLITRQPGFWSGLPRYAPGFEIMSCLEHYGFDVVVLTKGPAAKSQAWAEKMDWCRAYLPRASVTITEDKSLTYGAVLVDDWPPFLYGWLAHRPRGVCIVPAHPWNEGCDAYDPSRIFRYRGPTDIHAIDKILAAVRDRDAGQSVDVQEVVKSCH